MKSSNFLGLNLADFGKGLIMAVLGAIFGVVMPSIEAGIFVLDWTNVWHMALGAAVTYIVKNLFTNSAGQPLKSEGSLIK